MVLTCLLSCSDLIFEVVSIYCVLKQDYEESSLDVLESPRSHPMQ